MNVAGYTITAHDARAFTDDEIAEGVELRNAMQREVTPDDPPIPVEAGIASQRSLPARVRMWTIRARDAEGRLVGAAGTSVDPEHDDNPEMFWIGVQVLPEHRRRGVGGALLAELVEVAHAEGRSRLVGSTTDIVDGSEAFARAVGAEPKLPQHINHLLVDDIDRRALEKWRADGPARAAGYELIGWDGMTPEEHLEAFADLVLVMNTAPRDDLDINDFTLRPRSGSPTGADFPTPRARRLAVERGA